MTRIIQFPLKSDGKFGLKPANRKSSQKLEDAGQLNLFRTTSEAKVISITADDAFERAIKIHDSNPDYALKLYQDSIDQELHVADSYCNKGILYASINEQSKAIDAFTKSLYEEPRHFEAHFNLANIYSDEGNQPLAELHYKIASEIDPEDPNIFYNMALVCALQEKYDDALHSLNEYLSLQPDSVVDKEAEQLMAILRSSVDTQKGG